MLRPRFAAATPIERGFRQLSHGAMHYRAGGEGPPVLALHESPRSSLSLLPVIDALADRCRVIAPDAPGYGLSAPPPGEAPPLAAFTDAIGGLLDSLGLERVAIYGAHTGAALALAFAHRHPARVTGLVLDGVSAFDAAEVEAFRTRYLEPYRPSWDGAHVMRTWSRAKDLFTWFPWYDRTPKRRLAFEPGDLEALDRSALGFIQSGAHYAKAYIHAAAFDPSPVLRGLVCPATIMARPDDLIADHLARITPGPTTRVRRLGPAPEDWRNALREAVTEAVAGLAPAARPAEAARGSRFVTLGGGGLHAVLDGPESGPVRVLLPSLPGDILDLVARERRAHPHARLVALSPPGCGWSDPLAEGGGLAGAVSALEAAHRALGNPPPSSLAAEGASAVIAQVWARGAGWSIPVEAISPPAWLSRDVALPTAPPLQPLPLRWDGAHLTAAWFQIRELLLYDTPPGCGPPLRRADAAPDLARLERLFRSYVEGSDCAALLDAVIKRLRRERGGL